MFNSHSKKMQKVRQMIANAAATDAAILIVGERGVGKNHAARMIHDQSPRVDKPFTRFSVHSLGNTKGTVMREKLEESVALAAGGTFFIDHIHIFNQAQQEDLLAVLNNGGSFRFITSTVMALEPLVKKGSFNEELYHKACVSKIKLPALRERKEDIAFIVNNLLAELSAQTGQVKAMDDEAFRLLMERHWPGNIRELRNAVHHAYHQAENSTISGMDLPEYTLENYYKSSGESLHDELFRIAGELMQASVKSTGSCMEEYLRLVQPPLLNASLRFTGGNKSQAAQILGINRNTFKKMLRDYSIED